MKISLAQFGYILFYSLLFCSLPSFSLNHGVNQTPLCQAINAKNYNETRLILVQGANANEKCYGGYSTLHLAARLKQISIIKILITYGAHIDDQENLLEASPLHFAIKYADSDTVIAMLDYGANIESYSGFYGTPLNLAVRSAKPEILKILLDRNANINVKDEQGITPFFYVFSPEVASELVQEKMFKILLMLLRNGDSWRENIGIINEVHERWGSVLHYACLEVSSITIKPFIKMISLLLKHPQFDPSLKNKKGLTALEKVREQIARAENWEHYNFYLCPSNYGLNKPVELYQIACVLQG